jgi:hypothetical protein
MASIVRDASVASTCGPSALLMSAATASWSGHVSAPCARSQLKATRLAAGVSALALLSMDKIAVATLRATNTMRIFLITVVLWGGSTPALHAPILHFSVPPSTLQKIDERWRNFLAPADALLLTTQLGEFDGNADALRK